MSVRGDDATPWILLQDGIVVGVRHVGSTAQLAVNHPRLRAKFGAGGSGFRVTLLRCTELAWVPADEPPITEPDAIVASEPQLLDAHVTPGIGTVVPGVAVVCAGGVLQLRYATLELALDTGAPLALGDLRARSSVVALGHSEQ